MQLKLIRKNLAERSAVVQMQTFHKVMSPHRLEDCVSNKAACLLNWRCCLLACWFKLRTLTLLPLRVSALSSIRPLANLSLLIGIETCW